MDWLSIFRTSKVSPLKKSSDSDDASCPTVGTGSWKESISGKYMKVQQWRLLGSNIRFICGGRVILPKGLSFYFLIFLVCKMLCFLSVFGIFELWKNTRSFGKMVFPSILLLFGIYSIANVFCVIFTDPGILAPGIYDPIREFLIKQHRWKDLNVYLSANNKVVDSIEIEKDDEKCLYCKICMAHRAVGTFHCPVCLVCIDRYNHHCLILGTCIGRRNYGYFLKFMWSLTFSLAGMMIYSMINLITLWIDEGFVIAASKSPTSFVLLLGFIFPPCAAACIFNISYSHCRFVWSNNTLRETPYNQPNSFCGVVAERVNYVCGVICTKPPPPNINPHKYLCVRALPRDIGENTAEFLNEHNQDLTQTSKAGVTTNPGSKVLHTYTTRKIQGQRVLVRGPATLKRLREKHSWYVKKINADKAIEKVCVKRRSC